MSDDDKLKSYPQWIIDTYKNMQDDPTIKAAVDAYEPPVQEAK